MEEIVLLDLISLLTDVSDLTLSDRHVRIWRFQCSMAKSQHPRHSGLGNPDRRGHYADEAGDDEEIFFSLSVSGKSRLFWTQEGSPAGRKRNFHESLPGHRMPTANLSCFVVSF